VPAFAAEKLKENGGVAVSGKTPRQRLVTAGLRERKRKNRPYERRDRRPRFGEPVPFDGSRHGRFEGREKKRCHMNMAGGAIGKTRSLLSGEETAAAAMAPLSCQIKKYGIPEALCRGRKNACAANREPAAGELLAGVPAAEEANKFLSKTPVPKTSAAFAKPPAGPRDARAPLEKLNLREILCCEYRRSASRDCAVSFGRRLFQI
jgi:hypothetical protein